MKNKYLKSIFLIVFFMVFCAKSFAQESNLIDINKNLINAMTAYQVPVVAYAIIKDYKIIAVETLSIDPKLKVSKNSLFQAASLSKSVSAYGALKLVNQKKLSLDDSVNEQLKTWKIPVNQYNKNNPVSVRQLLDMTSGLSVSGFPGHPQGETLPSLQEILQGKPPANTPAINVFYKPGSRYFYSGGGFQVLEQLIEDITQQSFQIWMQTEILKPLKMHQSTFNYKLDKNLQADAVPGFLMDGSMIKGGWYNYVIASAGGLWSTPTDIAKFIIHVSNAYLGKDNLLVSQALAKEMLMRQINTDYGLGVVINGADNNLNFRKAGHNLGYHSEFIMFPNSGNGAVIMTNSENGQAIINYMLPLFALKYEWPCFFPYFDELIRIPVQACLKNIH